MDRNTLLAFFLIALVLIFTPKYIDLVAPPPLDDFPPDTLLGGDKTLVQQSIDSSAPNTITSKPTNPLSRPSINTVEKITTIDGPLYTAIVSSVGGGTIKSFYLKNYHTADSQRVNLLGGLSGLNLLTGINNADGDPIDLSFPWEQKGMFSGGDLIEIKSLTFSYEFSPGKHIERVLTFDPTSYTIGIQVRCDYDRGTVSGDLLVGWHGGLASTEKNHKDDHVYFKSYIFQGGEIENLKVKSGETESRLFNGSADWGAIRTKYFMSALIPSELSSVRRTSLSGTYDSLETYDVSFLVDIENVSEFSLYLGPLEYERIKDLGVGLERIMDFGWAFIRPISKGVLFALKGMHEYIPNYGFVLIIFSFLS